MYQKQCWNGLTIYASERAPIIGFINSFVNDFVEMNLVRRDFPLWKNYLIFGDTGDDQFCIEIGKSCYHLMDAVSCDVLETFSSFDELIS